MNSDIKPMKLCFIITDRGKGKGIIKLLNDNGFTMHTTYLGHGTAPSDFAAKLNLGEKEKVVLNVVADTDRVSELLALLKEKLAPGEGIAFSMPLSSLSNMEALKFLMGTSGAVENE